MYNSNNFTIQVPTKCNDMHVLIMPQEDDFHIDSMECPEIVLILLVCNLCTTSFLLKEATLCNELSIRNITSL
jgi:hypothetical protein